MRLNKYLAHCGVSSRRKCDQLIKDKKIFINGKIVIDYSYKVSNDDIVVFQNKVLNLENNKSIYLLNKPKGYICSNSKESKKRVIDLIKDDKRLYTVGRLDVNTSGAILITNNGDLANQLLHPRYNKEKKYIAKTKIDIPKQEYLRLKSGLHIGNKEIAVGEIKRMKKQKGYIYWKIKLTEGKNKEIKRIFEKLGSKVVDLHRYEFAGFKIDGILEGKYRKITQKVIKY